MAGSEHSTESYILQLLVVGDDDKAEILWETFIFDEHVWTRQHVTLGSLRTANFKVSYYNMVLP